MLLWTHLQWATRPLPAIVSEGWFERLFRPTVVTSLALTWLQISSFSPLFSRPFPCGTVTQPRFSDYQLTSKHNSSALGLHGIEPPHWVSSLTPWQSFREFWGHFESVYYGIYRQMEWDAVIITNVIMTRPILTLRTRGENKWLNDGFPLESLSSSFTSSRPTKRALGPL